MLTCWVSGIHGYPFIAWDGVKGNRQSGYCSHGSTLFPVWHRPFLALFEVRRGHKIISLIT